MAGRFKQYLEERQIKMFEGYDQTEDDNEPSAEEIAAKIIADDEAQPE